MKTVLSLLFFLPALYGQMSGGGPIGSTQFTDFQATSTATLLTVMPGRVSLNGTLCSTLVAPMSVQIASGSGGPGVAKLYVADSCAVVLQYPSTLTLSLTSTLMTAESATTPAVPETAFWLADVTINAGRFTAIADKRSVFVTGGSSDLSSYQPLSGKDAANGYLGLDGSGLADVSKIPGVLTQSTEFAGSHAVSVSAAGEGRALVETPLTIDDITGDVETPGSISSGSGSEPWNMEGYTDDAAPSAPSSANQFIHFFDRSSGLPSWILYGGTQQYAAPNSPKYVTTQAESSLSSEVSLGALADNSLVAVDVSASVATVRAAVASDVVLAFGSGSCSGYLKSDGTCDTPAGGGSELYTVTTDATTTRTLDADDCASVIQFTSASAVTVTVPTGLGAGCNVIVSQSGAGVVSFTTSGTTIRQLNGTAATAGQHSKVFLYATTDSLWELSGQVAGQLVSGLSATLAEARFPALDGDVITDAGDLTTAIAANAVTPAKASAVMRTRPAKVTVTGSGTAGVLQDTDDVLTDVYYNNLGQGVTLTGVSCKTDSATATRIQLQRDDGSPASILTDNAGAGVDCSSTRAAGTIDTDEDNIASTQSIKLLIVSAGGAAKEVTVDLLYTLD